MPRVRTAYRTPVRSPAPLALGAPAPPPVIVINKKTTVKRAAPKRAAPKRAAPPVKQRRPRPAPRKQKKRRRRAPVAPSQPALANQQNLVPQPSRRSV